MIDVDDDTRDRAIRILLLAVFSIAILSTNAANVVDGVLLDSNHTADSFEDKDVYVLLTDELQQDLAENISTVTAGERNATRLAESTLTEEYTRRVVNRNVEDVHAYLQGEQGETDIRWNLTGVQQRLAAEIDDLRVTRDLNATIPEAVVIEEDVSTGPLGTARTAIGLLPGLLAACVAAMLVVLGLYVYRLRSPEAIATETGLGLTVAGVATILLSALVLLGLRVVSFSIAGDAPIDPGIVFDGVARAIETSVHALLVQSLLILGIGVALVGLGRFGGSRPRAGVPGEEPTSER